MLACTNTHKCTHKCTPTQAHTQSELTSRMQSIEQNLCCILPSAMSCKLTPESYCRRITKTESISTRPEDRQVLAVLVLVASTVTEESTEVGISHFLNRRFGSESLQPLFSLLNVCAGHMKTWHRLLCDSQRQWCLGVTLWNHSSSKYQRSKHNSSSKMSLRKEGRKVADHMGLSIKPKELA